MKRTSRHPTCQPPLHCRSRGPREPECGRGALGQSAPLTFFSPRLRGRTLPKNKRIKVGETYLFLCEAGERASMRRQIQCVARARINTRSPSGRSPPTPSAQPRRPFVRMFIIIILLKGRSRINIVNNLSYSR